MEWLAVIIIILIVLVWGISLIRSAYQKRIRRHSWQTKILEANQLIKPIIDESYNQLTEEIRKRWPFVPFDFPTVDSLLANTENNIIYGSLHSQNFGVLAKKVLAPIVSKTVTDFINYNPNLSIGEQGTIDKIPTKLLASNEQFKITKDGRSPPDWAERRKIVHDRDGGCCRRCGAAIPLEKCHIHHIVRRSEGGSHSFQNLVTLCRDCHSLMPEHQKVDGGPFYSRYPRHTLHTEECYHAIGASQTVGSLASLIAKGYTPCEKCMP